MAQNLASFVKNPEKDFSRNRKLGFAELIRFCISMESRCISHELLKHFRFAPDKAPPASAFIQQRAKLLPDAFRHLLLQFNLGFRISPAKSTAGQTSSSRVPMQRKNVSIRNLHRSTVIYARLSLSTLLRTANRDTICTCATFVLKQPTGSMKTLSQTFPTMSFLQTRSNCFTIYAGHFIRIKISILATKLYKFIFVIRPFLFFIR